MTLSARKLNKMKLDFQGQANLWMCSWLRGGDSDSGSCIWADFEEWSYEKEWRAIHKSGLIHFPKEIIMSVYFGAKFNLKKQDFWIKQTVSDVFSFNWR